MGAMGGQAMGAMGGQAMGAMGGQAMGAQAMGGQAMGAAGANTEAQRSITNVAGNVHLFRNNNHNALLIDTNDGLVLVDPIQNEAATWIAAEGQKQFGKPITHILYSHAHWDHATGAAQIPGAEVIAHANAAATIEAGGTRAEFIKVPDTTYNTPVNKLDIGGTKIEMHHVPNGHTDDMSYIYLPETDILFVVDVISVNQIPWGALPWYEKDDFENIIDSALKFNASIVTGGHGAIGTSENIKELRSYMNTLRSEVSAAIANGQTLEQMQASITMDAYKDWQFYDSRLSANIEGMHKALLAEG